jgi:hypothetical protein
VFRVIPDSAVFDQVAALPPEALVPYADGQGTVTYLTLDDAREVHILLVQWAG